MCTVVKLTFFILTEVSIGLIIECITTTVNTACHPDVRGEVARFRFVSICEHRTTKTMVYKWECQKFYLAHSLLSSLAHQLQCLVETRTHRKFMPFAVQ